mmetsp:Transcript_40881/g.66483  ORF Transcript_40881/g.66483 Transcript_40881/m.66483 type:complete len:793 (+) Transcript_40881:215-2593(+)
MRENKAHYRYGSIPQTNSEELGKSSLHSTKSEPYSHNTCNNTRLRICVVAACFFVLSFVANEVGHQERETTATAATVAEVAGMSNNELHAISSLHGIWSDRRKDSYHSTHNDHNKRRPLVLAPSWVPFLVPWTSPYSRRRIQDEAGTTLEGGGEQEEEEEEEELIVQQQQQHKSGHVDNTSSSIIHGERGGGITDKPVVDDTTTREAASTISHWFKFIMIQPMWVLIGLATGLVLGASIPLIMCMRCVCLFTRQPMHHHHHHHHHRSTLPFSRMWDWLDEGSDEDRKRITMMSLQGGCSLFESGRKCKEVPSNNMRGQAWAALIGNKLIVTPELYRICDQLARDAIEGQQRSRAIPDTKSDGRVVAAAPKNGKSKHHHQDHRNSRNGEERLAGEEGGSRTNGADDNIGNKGGGSGHLKQHAIYSAAAKNRNGSGYPSSSSDDVIVDDGANGESGGEAATQADDRRTTQETAAAAATKAWWRHGRRYEKGMILGSIGTVYDIHQDISRTYVGRPGFSATTTITTTTSSSSSSISLSSSHNQEVKESLLPAGSCNNKCNAMEHILRAYCFYRPDVGYMQGMSYLVGHLLLYMDEYTAFVAFSNLLSKPFLNAFYMSGSVVQISMESRLAVFDHMFRMNLPKLHTQLKNSDVPIRLYFFQWALTLFAKVFPFETLSYVWHGYFVEGEVHLYKVGVSLLKIIEKSITNKPLRVIFDELTSPGGGKISTKELMKAMTGIRVTTSVNAEFERLRTTRALVSNNHDDNNSRGGGNASKTVDEETAAVVPAGARNATYSR